MKKCPECRLTARDALYFSSAKNEKDLIELGNNIKWFCRKHLIQEFKKHFLNFPGKMIVYYPELEEKKGNYTYYYTTIDKWKTDQDDNTVKSIQYLLESIKKKCERCNNVAQVAYIARGILKWQVIGKWYQTKWDVPLIGEVNTETESLCLECAFENIESSLLDFKYAFDSLNIPYGNSGILCPYQV